MVRKLSLREKSVIIGSGIFLMLFLLFTFGIKPLGERIVELKTQIETLEKEYTVIAAMAGQYDARIGEREKLKKKIKDRDPNFNLPQEITKIDTKLNFKYTSLKRHKEHKKLNIYAYYGATVIYKDKSLEEIVNYLYEIEKPEYGIIVDEFKLTPKKSKRGERDLLDFDIDLYSVGFIESEDNKIN